MTTTIMAEEFLPGDLARVREALLQATDEGSASARNSGDRVELLLHLLGPELCRRIGVFHIPPEFKLSVVIPVYNEVKTIEKVIARVRATQIPCEMVIIDDGSRDGTRDLLSRLRDGGDPANHDLKIVFHEKIGRAHV